MRWGCTSGRPSAEGSHTHFTPTSYQPQLLAAWLAMPLATL